MSAPKRIQLSRQKGWRKPDGAINVARPTRWGNPFRIGESVGDVFERSTQQWDWGGLRWRDDAHRLSRVETVEAFESWMRFAVGWSGFALSYEARLDLRDRDLACWCPLDQPCHADVLLKLANGG